ncbi:family 43 glycosylhydrolase [Anaerocolumna aminovalerica]|uniref:family 43 glycosylhydrolase n=1 Tax=Anaerocolumna aminovalerica TaxID=1527 RepID=UPI000BE441D6|nr:family 43 glycosylhydrolase [Anaerocolumna aminovalerica]
MIEDRMKIEEAILSENLDLLKEILAEDPSTIDYRDESGVCMSFIAAKTGNLSIVKYIVEYSRASMNTVDSKNRNILHYAAMSGNPQLAKYLVEKVGLSPVTPDVDLITPFEIAHEKGYEKLEKYFEQICGAGLSEMYKNPIRTGFYPDPSIVRVGEDFYMVNSSFIYFPCIPISHSKDLIHWHIIGFAITNPDWSYLDHLEGGRGYWAPDISYYEGRFYITATYRLNDDGRIYRKQMVVSSEKPEGPYSKPVFIDEDGIDPSIFNDEDGKRYMLLNRGARIFELNKDATKQISEAKLLYYGDQKRAPEGPHLLKKDGFYYLFLAEGGTGPGHRITVARSGTLFGNYEPCPYNPIMAQWDEKAGIGRCGHGKPVQTQNGEWYMVYLCGRMIGDGYTILGRETALDPIQWTLDGWPIVNGLKGPSTLQKKPNLPECIWDNRDFDDFDDDSLSVDWVFPRSPERNGIQLKNSKLWIRGSKAPLNSIEARNIVLRRQKDFVFTAETKMLVVPMYPGQDAGLICYYDENSWVKFGVFAASDGSRYIKLAEHIGLEDFHSREAVVLNSNEREIYLQVRTNYLRREFYYSMDGVSYSCFTTLNPVTYLSDEGVKMGKRFTGAMVGMYAYGGEKDLEVPFECFRYISGRH